MIVILSQHAQPLAIAPGLTNFCSGSANRDDLDSMYFQVHDLITPAYVNYQVT
jgi:hypothetical protein